LRQDPHSLVQDAGFLLLKFFEISSDTLKFTTNKTSPLENLEENFMSMGQKIGLGVLALVIVGLFFGIRFGLQYLNIATSYAAKTMCSGVFVSGRTPEAMVEDLYAVSFVGVSVDSEDLSASSSLYGLARAKAIYRQGLGCTLVNGASDDELRTRAGVPISSSQPENLKLEQKNTNLEELLDQTFTETNPKAPVRTRAVVVLQNGKLIGERYAGGFKAQTPLLGWSMTKSLTNAMIGTMVLDGKLEIRKPAPVDEWKNDPRAKITIDTLLRMSSGLAFVEDYASPSDATKMLFREKGAGAFAIGGKLIAEPDAVWSYSSGTTNILQEIMRRQFTNHADYLAYPHTRLFQKLGMNSAVLEADASGTYVGSSFMYATARDWAKFGQLYLQDGVWNGERILPEGWVAYSSTETPHSDGTYAAHFWLAHNDAEFPKDGFMAEGFEGQTVAIIPSQNLVIVRLGLTHGDAVYDDVAFVKNILAALKK
jgi:CubicO group peptidase (beta-lactamase class C family)